MSLPRNLDEFLQDFNDHKNPKLEDHPIARQFKDYLQKRDLTDEIFALRFLIYTQRFHHLNLKHNNNKGNKSENEMKEIFVQTGKMFLSKDNEDMLCLSDDKLYEDLIQAMEKVQTTNHLTEKDINLLKRARQDPHVRRLALDPVFMKFIKTQPTNTIACLLSIL